MARVTNFQTLVPSFDANRMTTAWVLRTINYDNVDTQNIQGLPRPTALSLPAPWLLPSYLIVSTP
jgi:hypothetical protein